MKTLSDIAREQNVTRNAAAKWLEKAVKQFGDIPHTVEGNRKLYSAEAEQNILSVAAKVRNQFATQFDTTSIPGAVLVPNQYAITPVKAVHLTDVGSLALTASHGLQDALGQAATLSTILATKVQLIGLHAQERHGERCSEVTQAEQILEQLKDVKASAKSLQRIERDRDIDHANKAAALAQEINQLSAEMTPQ